MTIATKNGVPIIKDGRLATNCACCGFIGNTCDLDCATASQIISENFYFVATYRLTGFLADLPFEGSAWLTIVDESSPYTCVYHSTHDWIFGKNYTVFSSNPDLSDLFPDRDLRNSPDPENLPLIPADSVVVEVWVPCPTNTSVESVVVAVYAAQTYNGQVYRQFYYHVPQVGVPQISCLLTLFGSGQEFNARYIDAPNITPLDNNNFRYTLTMFTNQLP